MKGRWALPLAAVLIALAVAPSALADSGGATIRSLPESEQVQVSAEVHHSCSDWPEESCSWFASASVYSASSECPITFDASHGDWTSTVETTPGTVRSTFAAGTYGLSRYIRVCLYVYSENESTLVGQSHVFDRLAGRELIPTPRARRCGTVSADQLRWDVTVHRGAVSCAVAKHTMHAYLHGAGTPNHNVAIINFRTLPGGWGCGEVVVKEVLTQGVRQPVVEPTCVRGSQWIEADPA